MSIYNLLTSQETLAHAIKIERESIHCLVATYSLPQPHGEPRQIEVKYHQSIMSGFRVSLDITILPRHSVNRNVKATEGDQRFWRLLEDKSYELDEEFRFHSEKRGTDVLGGFLTMLQQDRVGI